MNMITRWDPFRNISTLQEQVNRLFEDSFFRGRSDESSLAAWTPAVDIYEDGNQMVIKADLPDVHEKDIEVRLENNTLSIRGERKFEKKVSEENYLRVERAYGSFSRSFSLPTTVDAEHIHAEHRNGVLTVTLPKREESKPRQIKVSPGDGRN
ncbi:MAG TPA: Hsp20/alpha crystallin family protein [Terriglobia bacterium]